MRQIKGIVGVCLAAILMCTFLLPVRAADPRVIDNAGLLEEGRAAELEQEIAELSGTYDFDIVIVTEQTDIGDPVAYADDFFDYGGYGYGENRDGMLFLLSMYERDWVISTTGYGMTAFTDYGTDYIGSEVQTYFSDGEYGAGFVKFLDLTGAFLAQAETGEPYDNRNPYKTTADHVKTLLFILAASALIAFAAVTFMKAQMKTARPRQLANEYVKDGSFHLRSQRDLYLYSTMSRVAKPKPSSDGGTSSHMGSSGTSHGGSSGKF